MAAGYLIRGNAWGGAWGFSWWGSWGNAWGGWTAEIQLDEYHGGGGRAGGREQVRVRADDITVDDVLQQWDLLEYKLRQQRYIEPEPQEKPSRTVIRETGTETPLSPPPEVVLEIPGAYFMADAADDIGDPDAELKEQARRRRNQAALLLILSQV